MNGNDTDKRAANDPEQGGTAVLDERDWLRVTLACVGDAVIITDAQGCVVSLNPVAQSLTGWTQEDAAGKLLTDVFTIINEESRQPVESPTAKALREGVVVGLANHTLLIAQDGTERPIDDSAAPIRNDRGVVAGVVLVFRDASERRRQERAVREALAYAENIIATVREPLVVLDKSLRVKTANRAFYRTFHVSPEETENCFIFELGDRQWDIPRLRTLLQEVLPLNHSFEDFEVEHDFPIIGRKVMLLNARRVVKENDRTNLILLAIEDITERKHTEAQLRDSERRYRRLFETARDGLLILDAGTGAITDANPFVTELLGYAHDELLGKQLWQMGLFRDAEARRAAFRQLHEQGYLRCEHLSLESKSGQQVEVEFLSSVYPVDGHSVIQCNIRDITDRIRLEQAKAQAVELAEVNRRKDEFLAILSHELRNPLAPILNAVHIIRLERTDSPIQRQARMMLERQVRQIAHLINDLLEVSRIIQGKVQLHKEAVELSAVVDRAVETARPLIDGRKHRLSVTLPRQPVYVEADPARLEQVLTNLLNNAAKYTDPGGDICLTATRNDERHVVIKVRDNGMGIPPDLLPRIFDLFTQGDRSLDRSEGGLGIGLTLVRNLVEKHGGTVAAYSDGLGQGSEFSVRLPVLPGPAPAQQPDTPVAVSPPAHTLRVLVVDDDKDMADSLAVLLRMNGYEVHTAYSGPKALEAAATCQPDIILLDIGLPEIDGWQVARRLRHERRSQQALLVAITGYGQEADFARSTEAGFDYHMVKPIDPDKLQHLLIDLDRKHAS